jgi:sulfonate transport system permease protein
MIGALAHDRPAQRPRRRPLMETHRRAIVSTASVLVFLIAWQVLPALGWIDIRYTSQPSSVFLTAINVFRNDNLAHHASVSFQEFIGGFALSLVIGIPAGIVFGTVKTLRQFIDPPLMALNMAPRLALLPIIAVWLGIGMESKVAVVFLGAVMPIIVNTMAGVRETDSRLIRAARSFGAGRFDIFINILLPSSLPAVIMGVRLGIGRGILGVVVGEMYVAQAGIGFQIVTYGSSMRVDYLLVYTLLIAGFGYFLSAAMRMLEERLSTWRPQS